MPVHKRRLDNVGLDSYYRIEISPGFGIVTHRDHDTGVSSGLQKSAGLSVNRVWGAQAWLIQKDQAHIRSGRLAPGSDENHNPINPFISSPIKKTGDVFEASESI